MPPCRCWRGGVPPHEAGTRRRPARSGAPRSSTRPWPRPARRWLRPARACWPRCWTTHRPSSRSTRRRCSSASCTCRCRSSSPRRRCSMRCRPPAWTRCWWRRRWPAAWPGLSWWPVEVAGEPLMQARLPAVEVAMPAHTAKITLHLRHHRRAQGRVPERRSAAARHARPGRGDGAAADRAPPECLALCRAAGEHRRPDGAAPARCDRHHAAAARAGPDGLVELRCGAVPGGGAAPPAAQPDPAAADAARLVRPPDAHRPARAGVAEAGGGGRRGRRRAADPRRAGAGHPGLRRLRPVRRRVGADAQPARRRAARQRRPRRCRTRGCASPPTARS